MNINNYDFDLPQNLIGQKAIEPRDSCKLLVLNKNTGDINHNIFKDLINILDENCVLVINDTKVFPARLFGEKETGGRVEVLLLKQTSVDTFECIGKGKIRIGQKINFNNYLSAEVLSKDDQGLMVIRFNHMAADLLSAIDKIGITPLPPYIHTNQPETELRASYQTVYAQEKGSAAAPTAGLHFTETLLNNLNKKGIKIEKITLHIGLGTFKPVTDDQIISKKLHSENFVISKETANNLNQAKQAGKKIIAVGTTACRALESMSSSDGVLNFGAGETDIFIQPGYKFKFINGLITNFHLPGTSLLMLVSALTSQPNSPFDFKNFSDSPIGKAYQEAIKERYKFFSFGDAMLIY